MMVDPPSLLGPSRAVPAAGPRAGMTYSIAPPKLAQQDAANSPTSDNADGLSPALDDAGQTWTNAVVQPQQPRSRHE